MTTRRSAVVECRKDHELANNRTDCACESKVSLEPLRDSRGITESELAGACGDQLVGRYPEEGMGFAATQTGSIKGCCHDLKLTELLFSHLENGGQGIYLGLPLRSRSERCLCSASCGVCGEGGGWFIPFLTRTFTAL